MSDNIIMFLNTPGRMGNLTFEYALLLAACWCSIPEGGKNRRLSHPQSLESILHKTVVDQLLGRASMSIEQSQ